MVTLGLGDYGQVPAYSVPRIPSSPAWAPLVPVHPISQKEGVCRGASVVLAPLRRASEALVLGPPFSSDLNALPAEARMLWASETHWEAWGWHLVASVKQGAWGSPLSPSDERAP